MDFNLNEDHKLIQESARDFANEELAPNAISWDQNHEFPLEILKQMGEMGFMGMNLPEEYGGGGVDTISYCLATMEIGRADSSVAVTMGVNHLVCEVINLYGSEEHKQRYLPILTSGDGIGSFCLSEPQAGSDAQNQKTRATQDGDEYVINGKKAWITNGGFAHVFVVTAVTGEDDRGRKEITAFLVDADTKGLILGKPEHKMGQCASNTVEVTLDEVRLPASNMIGGRNGFKVMMNGLNSGRIGVAAMCCGIAQASFDAALEYSHDRTAFGKPIHQLQAIQLKLAEMATDLEAAKLLTLKAAQLKDQGDNFISAASMAKLFASEACNRIAAEALQIHGGNGYVKEYIVEKLYRDARVTTIYEGTSEIQKITIARQFIRKT